MASALDEDTQQSLAEGRESAKAFLRSIQKDLQKVFVVFLFAFSRRSGRSRVFIWDSLYNITQSNMSPEVAAEADVIATTPFEVILLQAKIGLIVGVIFAIPPFIYVARDELRALAGHGRSHRLRAGSSREWGSSVSACSWSASPTGSTPSSRSCSSSWPASGWRPGSSPPTGS